MIVPFGKSVICPVLIGRTDYCAALYDLIDRASTSGGRTVLLSGEAGIGKSRLIAELKGRAHQAGMLILQGNCFEPDNALPYAPLTDLLRGYSAARDPTQLMASMGFAAPELIKLVPGLAAVVPDLAASPALEPEQEKRRLFQALIQFFTHLVDERPLLVIVEDLHWSDDTSLEFLLNLARWVVPNSALLVVTYRSDEIHPALRHFLAGLDRQRLATEFALRRFSRAEVDAMLRAIFELPRAVRSDFLDVLYSLSDGNPFFIEEILKVLIATGDIYYADGAWDRKPIDELRIPRSVQDAVQRRVDQLSEATRHTLTLAAVLGQRFDFTLLQALTEQDEPTLLLQLKELIAAQLVVEASADQFAFRHALTRQTIYVDLLARARKTMHEVIARTIERLYAEAQDEHIADLAYHFYESEQWHKALDYATQAGERALALYAPRAAIEHFTRALRAAEHLHQEFPITLYSARGQAYDILGDFEAARSDYERVLGIAHENKGRRAEWEALMNLGYLWARRDYDQTGNYFRSALELAESLDDPILRARSLNRFGNWLVNTGQVAEGLQTHQVALDLFQALDNKSGMAETLDLLGMANGIYGDAVRTIRHYDRAIELLRNIDNLRFLSSSLASRSAYSSPSLAETSASALYGLEAANVDTAEALSLAHKVGSMADEAYAEWTGSVALVGFGDLGRALTRAQRSLQVAIEIEHRQWTAAAYFSLGHAYVAMLAPEQAIQTLEAGLPLAHEVGSVWWIGNISSYLALAYLQLGQPQQAEMVLNKVMPFGMPPRNAPERRMVWAWGEVALMQGNAAGALAIADQLIESAPGGRTTQAIPVLLKLRGQALHSLHRSDEAQAALEDALRGATERQARPLVWQIHVALGNLQQALKQDAQAQHEFAEASTLINSLAETIDDPVLRAGFTSAALARLPKEKPFSPRRADSEKFGMLTARERDVAAQIARGLSNREIAAILVVDERTVEKHVSNILSKLVFTSRRQIAAWAIEKGLTPQST